ncbi:MAG: HD family phosphohydrolase [Myxococcota bacterium]
MEYPLVQFLAFAAFVSVLVAILTTGFDLQGPGIDESSVGELAPSDVRASRGFTYTEPDVAATRTRKDEVASAVPPVFDWQEGIAQDKRDSVSRAFASMREALADRARSYLSDTRPYRLEQIQSTDDGRDKTVQLLDAVPEQRIVRWTRELRETQFDPYFDQYLADATVVDLARNGFSSNAENVLANLIGQIMSRMIVSDMRALGQDIERGIYLRRLRGEKVLVEYHVTSLQDRFIPVSDVDEYARELASRQLASVQDPQLREPIISAAISLAEANTFYNEDQTIAKRNAAREAVPNVINRQDIAKGEVIVEKDHVITERHYRVVQEMLEEDEYLNRTQVVSGIALVVLLLIVTFFVFGRENIRNFRLRQKDIVFMASSLLLMLLLTQVLAAMAVGVAEQFPGPAFYLFFGIPVAAGGMLIRLVLDNEHAVVFAVVYSILAGIIADQTLFFAAYTLIGTLVGVGAVQQVKHRLALMWSGLAVGAVNVASIVAYLLLQGTLFEFSSLMYMLLAFGSGIVSGFGVLAVLPLFEAIFGYTTDIKLLELANLNHPLLRELILRSPGSYHHSMMVGSLCEAAAEEVGANALLCRVGSYYHDVGKAKNPQYFAENQKLGENPHDKLKPNMSALIIKAHVKDGLEMARQHRLPVEIQDFIAEHHGTSLIAYFYHKAKQMEDPDIPEVDEKDYRYPGPKPQTRETAICLLADGTEAASRAMSNPTPGRLKGLVQTMINKAFTDGQLDECDLTLKDLNAISEAFTRILTGIYHHRPEYPDEEKDEKKEERKEAQKSVEKSDEAALPDKSSNKSEDGSKERDATPETESEQAGETETEQSDSDESSKDGLADRSSDVWDISEEQVENLRRERRKHADSDSDGTTDDDSSDSESAGGDDSDEDASSVSRVGTS